MLRRRQTVLVLQCHGCLCQMHQAAGYCTEMESCVDLCQKAAGQAKTSHVEYRGGGSINKKKKQKKGTKQQISRTFPALLVFLLFYNPLTYHLFPRRRTPNTYSFYPYFISILRQSFPPPSARTTVVISSASLGLGYILQTHSNTIIGLMQPGEFIILLWWSVCEYHIGTRQSLWVIHSKSLSICVHSFIT